MTVLKLSLVKTRLRQLGKLHTGLIRKCRAAGITAADYPLNTDRMGIWSLSAYAAARMADTNLVGCCTDVWDKTDE